jgi:hypothetical protein
MRMREKAIENEEMRYKIYSASKLQPLKSDIREKIQKHANKVHFKTIYIEKLLPVRNKVSFHQQTDVSPLFSSRNANIIIHSFLELFFPVIKKFEVSSWTNLSIDFF